jgi:hypothetical protein
VNGNELLSICTTFGILSNLPSKNRFYISESRYCKKKRNIGSMFPEKIIFDAMEHRTGKANEAMAA